MSRALPLASLYMTAQLLPALPLYLALSFARLRQVLKVHEDITYSLFRNRLKTTCTALAAGNWDTYAPTFMDPGVGMHAYRFESLGSILPSRSTTLAV
jgi:hypothetical protein